MRANWAGCLDTAGLACGVSGAGHEQARDSSGRIGSLVGNGAAVWRAGAGEISGSPDQANDPVLRRRRDGHRRPSLGGAHEGPAWHHLCREPGRCRRHHRRDGRGPLARRRPHYPARQHQRAGAQPDDVGEAVLRSDQGLCADLDPVRCVGCLGGERRAAGEDAQGIRRLRQGQSGQTVVRLSRHRDDDASCGRAAQAGDGAQRADARSVQGRGPRHCRSCQWPYSGGNAERHQPGAGIPQDRQGAHSRGVLERTAEGRSGDSDGHRGRLRQPGRSVVRRRVRAGRNAEAHRRPDCSG